ncbi:hypothetical protein AGMMS50255_4930 [Spirochaetia bacterium]|nr:hypothetical protein AGMMS50255_4930 [Spirochaetia bacterium]
MATLTYVDSNVLINAFSEDQAKLKKAWEVLNDPKRIFLWSNYLKLEVVPKPTISGKQEQVAIFLKFFDSAQFIPSSDVLIEGAQKLAIAHDLSPMDALHVAVAIAGHAVEFLTFEKPTKPFFQISPTVIKFTSLYEIF